VPPNDEDDEDFGRPLDGQGPVTAEEDAAVDAMMDGVDRVWDEVNGPVGKIDEATARAYFQGVPYLKKENR
jgi:hypothetical protein